MDNSVKFKTVEEYLSTLPADVKKILQGIRKTIKKAAPGAEEVISYNMPAFKQNGILVYYAAWKEHVGFYPASPGMSVFDKELTGYERSKGTIKFPLNQPLPMELITRIVQFRVEENNEKAKAKSKRKTSA